MKEIRIIIQGEHLKFATDLLDDKATGYTIIHNISGKGHHGFHTSHPMFNEMDSIVMLMTVVTPEKVEPILGGIEAAFRPLHRRDVRLRRRGQPRAILFRAGRQSLASRFALARRCRSGIDDWLAPKTTVT